MEQRENRFKKLRRLAKSDDQDEDDFHETINKKLKTEKDQRQNSLESENLYDYDDDVNTNKNQKVNKEAVPKRQVQRREKKPTEFDVALNRLEEKAKSRRMEEEKSNALVPFSLHEKATTDSEKFDSDENISPLKNGDFRETSKKDGLKRLKKFLDPNETKMEEEEVIKDEPECPICFDKIEKESARINCCNHIFCFDCIKDWSDRANQCPLCKKRFSKIQKYSQSGVKLAEVRIKFKNQEFEEPEFETIENTDEACYECGSDADLQRLLVCDQCHFYCCHTYCCTPPLRRVPIDPWFCNFCRPENVEEARSVNRARGTAQRDHTHSNRATQRRPVVESPPPRRNNLSRSNTARSNESAVTQSIRNSLPDDSFLKRLFDAADKEQGNKTKKKRGVNENSILKKYLEDDDDDGGETKRRRSKSKSTKKRTSRKTGSTSKERSRSKSAKSKKAVRRTSKSKPKSRSVKRTGDKKKKVATKKKVVKKRNTSKKNKD